MKALLVIDVQADFLEGGSLAVPEGNKVIPVINNIIESIDESSEDTIVIFTQDYHPKGHISFASSHKVEPFGEVRLPNGTVQVAWPDHCVEDTEGSYLHDDLKVVSVVSQKVPTYVISKGTDKEVDSYSGFKDNDGKTETGLNELLENYYVTDLYVCGLATDYCVKYTAIDGKEYGYNVNVILDAVKGVDSKTTYEALNEMVSKGINLTKSDDVIKVFSSNIPS